MTGARGKSDRDVFDIVLLIYNPSAADRCSLLYWPCAIAVVGGIGRHRNADFFEEEEKAIEREVLDDTT